MENASIMFYIYTIIEVRCLSNISILGSYNVLIRQGGVRTNDNTQKAMSHSNKNDIVGKNGLVSCTAKRERYGWTRLCYSLRAFHTNGGAVS